MPVPEEESVFAELKIVLEAYPRDISMAMIYSAVDDHASDKCALELQLSIGVPPEHVCAVQRGFLHEASGFLPFLAEARRASKCLTLLRDDCTLDERAGHLLDGFHWQGWGDQCRDLSFIPLYDTTTLIGFLILSTNPRVPFCPDSVQFINEVAQQVQNKWTASVTTRNLKTRLARERKAHP
ncbi:hypothetical protein MRB53_040864 [Persea americana]|nr:hypothetical protein MRB53_040864 [Persea americana]